MEELLKEIVCYSEGEDKYEQYDGNAGEEIR